jgi:hypothetical protein
MRSNVLLILLAAWLAIPGLAEASPLSDRVAVCHVVQGAPQALLISVGAQALEAHLAHGDFEPMAGSCSLPDTHVPCGGFANIPCPAGASCADVPGDGCDPTCGADCPGLCVVFEPPRCGRHGTCPPGMTCIDDPRDACHPDCGDDDCPTICATLTGDACAGFGGFPCAPDLACADVPGDDCDALGCPRADCAGTCVRLGPAPCGGADHLDCPAGQICIDDAADACGPDCGGIDCPGSCAVPLQQF